MTTTPTPATPPESPPASGDSQPVGILLHDRGRILAVNRAGADFFGRPVTELVCTHVADWVGDEARGALSAALDGGLASSRRIRLSGPCGHPLEMIPQGWLTFQSRVVQLLLLRSATAGGTDRWTKPVAAPGSAG
jgi:PAS domain-containing protein